MSAPAGATERSDGQNVRRWHWSSKDTSAYVKLCLETALQRGIFPETGVLAHCRITSAKVTGEASITTRKARTFLLYDLRVLVHWEGQLRDGDGTPLESNGGEILLPDVSGEMIDDLEVDFRANTSGSPLAEAMRREGAACVLHAVRTLMQLLQQQATDEHKGAAACDPATSAAAGVEGMRLDQKAPPGSDRAVAAGLDGAPLVLRYAARKLVAHPKLVSELRFGCCGLTDEHIPALVGALSFSQSKLQVLDLVFNHITDKGLAQLCKAVAAEGGADLTEIFLGGNDSTAEGRAQQTATLQTACPLLRVEWTPRLHKAEPLATVGLVYKNSPAKRAGLVQGDKVMAWGMLQTGCNLHDRFGFQPDYGNDPSDPFLRACKFENVLQSISPFVRSSISQPIDVVVERVTDAGRAEQFMLTLVPERWSGQGLIGCILK